MSGLDKATIRPGRLHYRTSLERTCIKKKKRKKKKTEKRKEKRIKREKKNYNTLTEGLMMAAFFDY
jgi:hypothetical protein